MIKSRKNGVAIKIRKREVRAANRTTKMIPKVPNGGTLAPEMATQSHHWCLWGSPRALPRWLWRYILAIVLNFLSLWHPLASILAARGYPWSSGPSLLGPRSTESICRSHRKDRRVSMFLSVFYQVHSRYQLPRYPICLHRSSKCSIGLRCVARRE